MVKVLETGDDQVISIMSSEVGDSVELENFSEEDLDGDYEILESERVGEASLSRKIVDILTKPGNADKKRVVLEEQGGSTSYELILGINKDEGEGVMDINKR